MSALVRLLFLIVLLLAGVIASLTPAPSPTPTVEPTPPIVALPSVTPLPPTPTVEPTPLPPTPTEAPLPPTVEPTPLPPTVEPTPLPPTVEPTPQNAIPTYPVDVAAIFAAHNTERASRGIAPLAWDNDLAYLATLRSEDMAVNNYFSHYDLDGHTAFDLMADYGYRYAYASENIFWCRGYPDAQIADVAMTSWMNSPSHKEGLLSPSVTHCGIGIAQTPDGKTYITALFSAPR
jgi:uncharacterized protein YkwD